MNKGRRKGSNRGRMKQEGRTEEGEELARMKNGRKMEGKKEGRKEG